MKIRKVVSAGNRPTPTMEEDGKVSAEAKTTSLLGGQQNRHSANEVCYYSFIHPILLTIC